MDKATLLRLYGSYLIIDRPQLCFQIRRNAHILLPYAYFNSLGLV